MPIQDNPLFPAPTAPGSLRRWLSHGVRTVGARPLFHCWLSVCALVPLAFVLRWWPPIGWMVGLAIAPVFLAIPWTAANRAEADAVVPIWCVLDPWYAPMLRRKLLVLGGFLAVLGVVAFGLQLSVVGASAILFAGGVGADGGWVLLLTWVTLVATILLTTVLGVMGFMVAIPLTVQRPVPTLHAMGASIAVARRRTREAAAFAGLYLLLPVLAVPTLGLSLLLGFPIVSLALYEATREWFPAPNDTAPK